VCGISLVFPCANNWSPPGELSFPADGNLLKRLLSATPPPAAPLELSLPPHGPVHDVSPIPPGFFLLFPAARRDMSLKRFFLLRRPFFGHSIDRQAGSLPWEFPFLTPAYEEKKAAPNQPGLVSPYSEQEFPPLVYLSGRSRFKAFHFLYFLTRNHRPCGPLN